MSFLFDLLTSPLGLPISAIWEWIILAVIGLVAFAIGWEVSPGGPFGSLIHWGVRLIVFIALWGVAYVTIAAVQWIIANWVIALVIAIFVVAGVWLLIRAISNA